MKKDIVATPLLPFTDEEELALSERLGAMNGAALGHYVESARLALGNKALDKSWRPRIQFGLDRAEAALLALPPEEVKPPAAPEPTPAKASRSKKAVAAEPAVEVDETDDA